MHIPRPSWSLFAHPLLLGQLARIAAAGNVACVDFSSAYGETKTRLLTALRVMMTEIIPADPLRAEYRLDTAEFQGWRQARFAAGRFAILFRADAATRTILFGWIRDAAARPSAAPIQADREPAILFGRFCTVTKDGRFRLPQALRESAGLTAGARLYLHFDGVTLRIEAASNAANLDPALGSTVTCLDRMAIRWPAAMQAEKMDALASL